MAQAPTPGVSKRAERDKQSKMILEIKVRGETKILNVNNMSLQERLVCRKATGLPIDGFLGQDRFGLDSLMVVWWMARRGEGDVFLTLDKVAEDPMWDDLDPEDIEVDMITPDEEDDHPES